ncbi:MAG: MFS transporter [Rothia sp. (in: high G+C Gram-positive bacteria)]|uniref:MFS transporter n=1 Tax=Rothia sp. (in: high G+C Gram-positive bacteria) TaxID=1885016 RepID=UPI0026DFEBB2|nr:MFS transporter [Rothia sp. (in: high G+C Gram-positive bacteria)]MDO5750214.1 MFS transporter [Rothia sp. (in: high G+C Gram-positive bacteria)]
MTTFIFTVYLTSVYFGDPAHTSQMLSYGMTAAGVLIALLAPVTGQRADRSGRNIFWLGVNTLILVALTVLCFFVYPSPQYLWLGVGLISVAAIFNEFAVVNYNAVLPRVSTPANIGKISGIGWSAGYFGGIVALGLVLLLFIGFGESVPALLNLPTDDALNIRAIALFVAAWVLVFCTPVLVRMRNRNEFLPSVLPVRERRSLERGMARFTPSRRGSLVESYRELWRTVVRLRRTQPQTLKFLVASAVFRDGLVGIYTFGGILAAGSFGFTTTDVLLFGIAANAVAGVGAIVGGYLDDYLGPKMLILLSLGAIMLSSIPLFMAPSGQMFWVCGLLLCMFIGPAQSASRTFLARIADPGTEGELFGLYSTTGRATSFLAPLFFGVFVTLYGQQIWGMLGIMLVVALGLALTIPLQAPSATRSRKARRLRKKIEKQRAQQNYRAPFES